MRNYAKAIVAVIGATMIAFAGAYGEAQWLTVALAFVTAFGVYVVPNFPQE